MKYCIYLLIDEKNLRPFYVGMTNNLPSRVNAHTRRFKKQFLIKILFLTASKYYADMKEAYYIEKYSVEGIRNTRTRVAYKRPKKNI